MALKFTFESFGDKLIHRELLDIADRAEDNRPAWYAIADDLRAFETERFDSRGDGTWEPLMASTVREKLRAGQDPRILHATLALRTSLTHKRAKGAYVRTFPNFMLFGTTVPYAKYLQSGTRNMVARKPLGFGEEQKRNVLKHLQRFVMTGTP